MNEAQYTLELGQQLGKALENLSALLNVIENMASRLTVLEAQVASLNDKVRS